MTTGIVHVQFSQRSIILILFAIIGLIVTGTGFLWVNDDVTLIGLCIILGLDVKFIDQLIDDDTMKPHRKFAIPLALLIPILMGYLATIHDPVFGMVLGTAAGLLLAGKLDHPAFLIAAVGFMCGMIAFVVIRDISIATTSYYLIPMAAFGSYGDEFGHERIRHGNFPNWVVQFFEHRFLLKSVAAFSVLIGFADMIHLIGFLCWDATYDSVAYVWKMDGGLSIAGNVMDDGKAK
jgi:hypothetical protein